MKKKFIIIPIFIITSIIIFLGFKKLQAINTEPEGYDVPAHTTTDLTLSFLSNNRYSHGIQNNCTHNIFVPTRTKSEFDSFLNNKPACINIICPVEYNTCLGTLPANASSCNTNYYRGINYPTCSKLTRTYTSSCTLTPCTYKCNLNYKYCNGECIESRKCCTDADCDEGKYCNSDGLCVTSSSNSCFTDEDCNQGEVCINGTCEIAVQL